MINHALCVVSQMWNRYAEGSECHPSRVHSESFLSPPVFGQGSKRKKVHIQSQPSEEQLAWVGNPGLLLRAGLLGSSDVTDFC